MPGKLSRFGMAGRGGIATPAVARSRWRWTRVRTGSAMKTTARASSENGHR